MCLAIERLPRKDESLLLHLEILITAGFVSRRRSIVNLSIALWNKTFGKQESLRYPSRLEKALRRLGTSVELCLPSLEPRDEDIVSIVVMLINSHAHAQTVRWTYFLRVRQQRRGYPAHLQEPSRQAVALQGLQDCSQVLNAIPGCPVAC